MCTDTCNWSTFAALCTIFAICGMHWIVSSQIHCKTWSRPIVFFFLWLTYGFCAIETSFTPPLLSKGWKPGLVLCSNFLWIKTFHPRWKLVKTQSQSSKGSLIQESEEEDQRVPSSQGYISSEDCWRDKEQMKVLGRGADQSNSLEDTLDWSSALQDSIFMGSHPGWGRLLVTLPLCYSCLLSTPNPWSWNWTQ